MSDNPRKHCTYDPLKAFMEHYSAEGVTVKATVVRDDLPLEQRLEQRIVDGNAISIEKDLQEAMKTLAPLEIVNTILLNGMKTVGELFGSGQMQLPFVLQSAQTMKTAVAFLESYMDRVEGATSGTIVLATVKGDVHDIGKNLVDIILTNNGYRVINLGIKVPIETMLQAALEHHADAIGMSGLLVKSTLIMKQNLELMQNRGMRIPVILGGAALTRRFVEEDLRSVYNGDIAYARDAFAGLRFMEELADRKAGRKVESGAGADISEEQDAAIIQSVDEPDGAGAALETSRKLRESQAEKASTPKRFERNKPGQPPYSLMSEVARDVPVPRPPFWGSKVVDNVSIDKVFEYINPRALIRGQWQIKRGKRSAEEYEKQLETEIYPVFAELKLRIKREKIFQPRVIYGYFPCNADGNELVIFKPKGTAENDLHTVWDSGLDSASVEEWQRFAFPRQDHGKYLCISDFFRPMASGEFDVCAFQIVTIGQQASDYTAKLFAEDKYQDYLYVHGMSVECAEALAEYWHKAIREEMGIAAKDAEDINRLFSQGYQGSRYSFGYPACPNLEDHVQLFSLLRPDRIGISLTEEYQLVPEQSTSAVIVHHPEAKYFNVR